MDSGLCLGGRNTLIFFAGLSTACSFFSFFFEAPVWKFFQDATLPSLESYIAKNHVLIAGQSENLVHNNDIYNIKCYLIIF